MAKALDYSVKRGAGLTRNPDDGAVPIDNNRVENTIRPWALGRSNWLFDGSLRSGKRAAAIMSLIQSARMNGHDPFAYLKDVLGSVRKALILGDAALKTASECSFTTRKLRFLGCFRLA